MSDKTPRINIQSSNSVLENEARHEVSSFNKLEDDSIKESTNHKAKGQGKEKARWWAEILVEMMTEESLNKSYIDLEYYKLLHSIYHSDD